MPSPFPGMDPFLEDAEVWPDFHTDLATELKHRLNRRIGPKYYAAVEIQSVPHELDVEISNAVRPDVNVFEPLDVVSESLGVAAATFAIPTAPLTRPTTHKLRAVRVYRTKTSEVVTAIEMLSPFNKRPNSEGLAQYRHKRAQILSSRVHLVEIDLLRGGVHPGDEVNDEPLDADYVLLVNRARYERASEIWPVSLDKPLPLIPVPLLAPDPDVPLDLNEAIREVYAGSGYDWRINYQAPVPLPTLRPAMAAWVTSLTRSQA